MLNMCINSACHTYFQYWQGDKLEIKSYFNYHTLFLLPMKEIWIVMNLSPENDETESKIWKNIF